MIVEHSSGKVRVWESGFDTEKWEERSQKVGELGLFVQTFGEQRRV